MEAIVWDLMHPGTSFVVMVVVAIVCTTIVIFERS
jgi:hypothetical protein